MRPLLPPSVLPGAAHAGAGPDRAIETLFDGAEILARRSVDWDPIRLELMTMRRGESVRNELQTNRHALFMGINGDTHVTNVQMDGVPSWQGIKGPGASAFCPAGRHVLSHHGAGTGTTMVLFFAETAIEALLHQPRPLNWQGRPSADDPFISAGAAELASALLDTADELALLRAESVAVSLVLHTARRFSGLAVPPQAGTDGAITRALDLIHATLPAAASLEQLAAAAGLPRARLLTCFKMRTGLTPHQYIIRQRLSRARFLLSSTNRSLASVADAVGCANAEHLGRMFRQHLGLSPNAWRRLHDRR